MQRLRIGGGGDYGGLITAFRREQGIRQIIGISGGADDKHAGIPEDDPLQQRFLSFSEDFQRRILTDALRPLRNHRVGILTGGTKWGVPRLAIEVARDLGLKTIGVLPKAGEHHALDGHGVDLQIVVEPLVGEGFWGDEGPVWTALVDGLIVMGGGAGTLTECAHLMKINESLCKRGDRPKFMVPIHGTGGVAEQLHQLFSKPSIRDKSMPRDRVHTGSEAARLLIEALDLEECYDPANS